jgi:hypothetical protein
LQIHNTIETGLIGAHEPQADGTLQNLQQQTSGAGNHFRIQEKNLQQTPNPISLSNGRRRMLETVCTQEVMSLIGNKNTMYVLDD